MKFKKLFLALTMIFAIALAGCTLQQVRSIRVVSGVPSSLELDAVVDLHEIVIEVLVDGNVNQVVYGDTVGVSIIGLDTSTSGQKTAVVSYKGVSVSVSYLVVGADSKVSNVVQLGLMLADPSKTVITLEAGTYDLSSITINRSVVLRAARTGTVTINNAKINFPVGTPGVVEFRNIDFANNGQRDYVLQVKTSRSIDDNTIISNFDRVVLNNATITGYGAVTNGISLDGKTHFEMYSSKMVTPTLDDYFKNMINFGSKAAGVINVLENNEFKCNFWYGLYSLTQATIRGNLIEGTIPSDTHLRDDAYAPIYNVTKQPVAFHAVAKSKGATAGMLKLVITNNTIKNVENVLRVYYLDYNSTTTISQDLIFSNNMVTNSNYLVNHSSESYSKDVLSIAKAGLRDGSTYQNDIRGVVTGNVGITGDFGHTAMRTGDNYRLYKGLVYQEKGTSDEANRYIYVGKYDGKYYLAKVFDSEFHFYQLTSSYSADGLDTRTIVEVTPQTNSAVYDFLSSNSQYFAG